MADLIQFPAQRARPKSVYQLRRFAPDGGILSTLLILARDEATARRQAHGLTAGLRGELWSNGRFLDHFAPPDQPVATAIRLLDDQDAPDP